MSLDLLENLKKNNSVEVQLEAKDWKEAIKLCINPLINSKVVDQSYIDSIIESVNENGPYFIIAKNVAMPHSQAEHNVNDNGFSLITLKKEIYFENDSRPVRVLIGLASNSPDIHISVALPQIVAIFENEEVTKNIVDADSKEKIFEIISKVDLKKYL